MAEEFKFTKYEKARMIGARSLQIAMGAPFLVNLDEADLEKINFNPIDIAKLEMEAGVIPLAVVRPMPKRAKEEKTKAN